MRRTCKALFVDSSGKVLPIAEYDHTQGTAVIAGYVYKGSEIPSLTDLYIFGDLSSGNIWYLREGPQGTFTQTLLFNASITLSSFGQDVAGEIYALDYGSGNVLKLVAQ